MKSKGLIRNIKYHLRNINHITNEKLLMICLMPQCLEKKIKQKAHVSDTFLVILMNFERTNDKILVAVYAKAIF